MRSRPRTTALTLALALGGLVLTACNSSNALSVGTTVVPPSSGCDAGRVLVVGAPLDLSGPGAAVGHEELTGLELGIDRVNAEGGVWPRDTCLELMYKNDRGNPVVDARAMLDLVNAEKASVVVDTFAGAPTPTYLGSLGVPTISLSDLERLATPRVYPNTFPLAASTSSQAYVMGKALEKAGVRSVGLVVADDAASRQGAGRLSAVSAADGFSVVARARVSASGRGAAAAISRVKAAHPQVLVVMDDTAAVASVLTARAAQRWHVPVLAGPSATTAPALAPAVGRDIAGVSVVVPVGAVKASGPAAGAVLRFRSLLLARLRTSSLRGSIIPYAEAYDGVVMIANAINGAQASSATDVTSFLQNANYQGVLDDYTYSAGAHTGIDAAGQTVVPLSGLTDGLLAPVSESAGSGETFLPRAT